MIRLGTRSLGRRIQQSWAKARPPNLRTWSKNDKCRDLKALWIHWDDDWICIRLDAAQLYEGWNAASEKCRDGRCATYPNVSVYHIYFNVPGAVIPSQSGYAAAVEGNFGDYAWHFFLALELRKYPDGYQEPPWLLRSDWTGGLVSGARAELKGSCISLRVRGCWIGC